MKELIKDYQIKLKNIEELLSTSRSSGSASDIEKFSRLNTKKYEFMSFITELERIEIEEKDKYIVFNQRSDKQKLIDITFEVAMTITSERSLKRLNNADLAKWVREQLKACGFETSPCGASWGVLK